MRLKSIRITNYRSFGNTENEIQFPNIKRPISMIGHNNCGKTNALNAILIGTGEREDWYRQRDYDFHNRDTSQQINIITRFTEGFTIVSPYPGNKADKLCTGTEFVSTFTNGRSDSHLRCIDEVGNTIIKQEKMKARGLPASFTSQRTQLKVIYVNFHDIDKHLSINEHGLLGELFREIKDDFYQQSNTISTTTGDQPRKDVFESLTEKLKRVLHTDMLEGFIDQLRDEVSNSLELQNNLINFDFAFSAAREIYNRAALLVTDAQGKVALPVTSLGSGLKAMIIVAMLKVLAERNEGEKIFILEEPETFLHELYQDYLYSVLCQLAENNQVIYTTHCKKFVDIFEPRSIIKIHNADFIQSKVVQTTGRIDVPQEALEELSLDSVDDFGYFMRSLDPNLGLVLFARKVLLVEGPHDVLAYRLAFKDMSLSSKNIAIVAVWGKDTSLYIAKLLDFFLVDYLLIHDWDLDDKEADINIDQSDPKSIYNNLSRIQRMHYTKNRKLAEYSHDKIHWNKKNLEEVLGIEEKGTPEIAEKLGGRAFEDIMTSYPDFIDDKITEFMQ